MFFRKPQKAPRPALPEQLPGFVSLRDIEGNPLWVKPETITLIQEEPKRIWIEFDNGEGAYLMPECAVNLAAALR